MLKCDIDYIDYIEVNTCGVSKYVIWNQRSHPLLNISCNITLFRVLDQFPVPSVTNCQKYINLIYV